MTNLSVVKSGKDELRRENEAVAAFSVLVERAREARTPG